MTPTKFLYRIRKGETDYIIKDKENEQRFAAGVLKVENGGTGAQGEAELKEVLLNMIYPVGSIYMSVSSTDPGTIFGGTWERIKDRFLLAAGDTYTAGNTGGAASTAYTPAGTVGGTSLIQEQIPAHSHSFTPAGTVANHSHSFTPAGSVGTTGSAHTHDFTGTSHTHGIQGYGRGKDIYIQYSSDSASIVPSNVHWLKAGDNFVREVASGPDQKASSRLTADSVTAGGAIGNTSSTHTHTFSGTAGNTGNTQPSFTGTAGTTGLAGGGAAHDHSFTGAQTTIATMPPYQVVYMWKRVADPTT